MAGIADRQPAARREVGGEDRGRQRRRADPVQPLVERTEHAAVVDNVHATAQLIVRFVADRSHGAAMAGDIGDAHPRKQPGAAHRQVVHVAAPRGFARHRIEHAAQPRELDDVVRRLRAAPHLGAGQARGPVRRADGPGTLIVRVDAIPL